MYPVQSIILLLNNLGVHLYYVFELSVKLKLELALMTGTIVYEHTDCSCKVL